MCIRTEERDYTPQHILEEIAVPLIRKRGGASFSEILAAVEAEVKHVDADDELVCKGTRRRISKLLENTSNHGTLELNHNILTLSVREANRLGYKAPSGLKFKEVWYMTAAYAKLHGYPTLDTTNWNR